MNNCISLRRHRDRGVSLIELMVGVAIGMVAIIVVMQVLLASDSSRRGATSTDDAQTVGAIALTSLQRDIRQAGQGFSSPVSQAGATVWMPGCTLQLPNGAGLSNLAPVVINSDNVPAGDANTDTLLVVYGTQQGSPEGDRVTAQNATNSYAVATPESFNVGDQVIAVPPTLPAPSSACSATLVLSPIVSIGSPNVVVTTGTDGMAGGTLFDLGQTPKIMAYAVRGGNLTFCDFNLSNCSDPKQSTSTSVWVPIASNVVSMRAQYGEDTSAPMDGVVDGYDQTTPNSACGWVRISSLRLALVARSTQYDKNLDISTEPGAMTAATHWSGSADLPIDLSGGVDWTHYRYKKIETTVPLRNIAFFGQGTGC